MNRLLEQQRGIIEAFCLNGSSKKYDVKVWNGFICLKTECTGELLEHDVAAGSRKKYVFPQAEEL
jgi:hypothetical protein